MTARIGRVYRTGEESAWSKAFQLSSDGRLLFVGRRERLRQRIGNGALIVAWTVAVLALIGGSWFAM
jgi:hypothetical protein